MGMRRVGEAGSRKEGSEWEGVREGKEGGERRNEVWEVKGTQNEVRRRNDEGRGEEDERKHDAR